MWHVYYGSCSNTSSLPLKPVTMTCFPFIYPQSTVVNAQLLSYMVIQFMSITIFYKAFSASSMSLSTWKLASPVVNCFSSSPRPLPSSLRT